MKEPPPVGKHVPDGEQAKGCIAEREREGRTGEKPDAILAELSDDKDLLAIAEAGNPDKQGLYGFLSLYFELLFFAGNDFDFHQGAFG